MKGKMLGLWVPAFLLLAVLRSPLIGDEPQSGLGAYRELLLAQQEERHERRIEWKGEIKPEEKHAIEAFFDSVNDDFELFWGDTVIKAEVVSGEGVSYVSHAHVEKPRDGYWGDLLLVLKRDGETFRTTVVDGPEPTQFAVRRELELVDFDSDGDLDISNQVIDRYEAESFGAAYTARIYQNLTAGYRRVHEGISYGLLEWRDLNGDGTLELIETDVSAGEAHESRIVLDEPRVRWLHVLRFQDGAFVQANECFKAFYRAKRDEYAELIGESLESACGAWSAGVTSYSDLQAIGVLVQYVAEIDGLLRMECASKTATDGQEK